MLQKTPKYAVSGWGQGRSDEGQTGAQSEFPLKGSSGKDR
jgi:hypothetical protein